jgi:hypothetical protein
LHFFAKKELDVIIKISACGCGAVAGATLCSCGGTPAEMVVVAVVLTTLVNIILVSSSSFLFFPSILNVALKVSPHKIGVAAESYPAVMY